RRPDPAEPRLPSASPINFITTGQLITIVNIAVRCAFVNSPLRHVSRYSIRFFIVWHGAAGSFRHARTERQQQGAFVMRGLSGRRVVLTGGASGIGRATAIRLAQEGCQVGILDLDAAGAEETVRLCSGQARAWTADISDRGAVERGVAGFEAAFGPPDLLANIAGWDLVKNYLDTDPALWDRIIRINLYGPLHMHHVVVRGMAERGFGRVVNVASDAGRVGSSGEAVYAA